jgi:orotidine-5'-phosphate decarboxylase
MRAGKVEKLSPLILALDLTSEVEVARLCHLLREKIDIYKVGLQLFLARGRSVVDLIHALGAKVFLDLKFNDIPNQVVSACHEVVKMGVEMFTIHTTGGFEMMRRAAETVREYEPRPKILGVTILTSLDEQIIRELGIQREVSEQVVHLAKLAQKAGLDGVVSSPLEIEHIREACGKDFLTVVPGIRPREAVYEDQRRVLSPQEAIRAGASFLVVGRPIIRAADPLRAVSQMLEEIGEAGK